MKIRIGVEGRRATVLNKAREIGAPLLLSANSLWNSRKNRFEGFDCYAGFDLALDSGGFVAMKRYGRYRWDVGQYVNLAATVAPTWWAQMDFCCEPEIASDAAAVAKRIDATVEHLHACQGQAKSVGASAPMPVLQGWKPKDYVSGPAYDRGFEWPEIVGVGSVCRRPVSGPQGLIAVVGEIHAALPENVRLHLFGVKSSALRKLIALFPGRVASIDSMAWNIGGWWECHKAGLPWNAEAKANYMAQWFCQQTAKVAKATAQSQFAFPA